MRQLMFIDEQSKPQSFTNTTQICRNSEEMIRRRAVYPHADATRVGKGARLIDYLGPFQLSCPLADSAADGGDSHDLLSPSIFANFYFKLTEFLPDASHRNYGKGLINLSSGNFHISFEICCYVYPFFLHCYIDSINLRLLIIKH